MIEAELPDGTVLEFPDGTDRAVIQRAVKARLGKPASTPSPTNTGAPAPVEGPSRPLTPQQQQQATHAAKPDEFQRAGDYGPFTAGVADSAIKTGIGLDQLNALTPSHILVNTLRGRKPVQGDLPESQGVLSEMKKESAADPESGMRTLGRVAGSTAQIMLPGVGSGGGAVLPTVAKTIAARSTPKIGAMAGAAGSSGLAGMVMNPGEGVTPQEQMADRVRQSSEDALYGAGTQQVGRVLSKVFRGANAKPDAIKLFEQDVNPTMQQAASNPVTRFVGGLASGATNVKERQAQEVLDALTKRASGGKASLAGGTLKERTDMLENILSNEYDTALKGKKFPISPTTRGEVAQVGADVQTRTGQFGAESEQASKTIANVMGDSKNNINVGIDLLMKNYMNPLAMEAAMEKNPRVREALLAARDVLMEKSRNARLSPDELKFVHQIDSKWYDLSRLRDVSTGAAQEGEGVSVRGIANAYANAPPSKTGNTTMEDLVGPAMRIIGTTPTQNQARGMATNVKRVLPLAAAGAATGGSLGTTALMAAPVYALSAIGQSAPGARAIFGQTEKQKLIAELLRKLGPYTAAAGAVQPGD